MCHGVVGNSQPSTHMKLRELAYFGVQRSQSRQWPPTKSHRQIRVYIHSLGETSMLHRRDTSDFCPGIGRTKARKECLGPENAFGQAPMDSRSASANAWL